MEGSEKSQVEQLKARVAELEKEKGVAYIAGFEEAKRAERLACIKRIVHETEAARRTRDVCPDEVHHARMLVLSAIGHDIAKGLHITMQDNGVFDAYDSDSMVVFTRDRMK